MLGVAINALAVIIGSFLGFLLHKGISEKINNAIMMGVGLCVVYIGIDGLTGGVNPLVAVLSIVPAAIIGTLLDFDGGLNRFGEKITSKFAQGSGSKAAEGFVTASLLFCIGAMAVVGSISAGLTGDNSILLTKSVLDFISSTMLSAAFGLGVMLSVIPLTIYQGGIALFANFLSPVLTDSIVAAITCVGSILILALGLNILKIAKIKIANLLPAIIFAPFAQLLVSLI